MVGVERARRADRQSDTMDRQRVTLAQLPQHGVRRSARAHIILGMHLDEPDRLFACKDCVEMLRLEADAGSRGER